MAVKFKSKTGDKIAIEDLKTQIAIQVPESKNDGTIPSYEEEVIIGDTKTPSTQSDSENIIYPQTLLVPEFKDEFFEALKAALKDPTLINKNIKYHQEGTQLYLYQGQRNNIQGVINYREGKSYKIRINNSYLLKKLKQIKSVSKYFKDIL